MIPDLDGGCQIHLGDNTNTCHGWIEQEATEITEMTSLLALFAPVQKGWLSVLLERSFVIRVLNVIRIKLFTDDRIL